MEELERNFKANGGEFREFNLGELFDIVSTKSLDEGKLEFLDDGINFVGRVNEFNGIKGKIAMQKFEPNEPQTITATVIGNYKYVKFQQEPYYCSQNINKLIPKFKINNKIAIYFITLISKFTSQYNGQQAGYKLDDIKEFKIVLPCDSKGDIAFHYMESYIRELEALRLSELEAYLAATGLKDYELNKKELDALAKFDKMGGGSSLKEFRIGDLFEINSSKKKFNAINLKFDGKYPYVARGEKNNGIRGYINQDIKFLNDENTISFGQDTATMFYQENGYFTGDKIKIFKSKFGEFCKLNAIYQIVVMKKSFSNFSWGSSSFNQDILNNVKIQLPTKNSQPDFEFMQDFITGVQKLVIKDVVQWSEARLRATKEAIG